MSDDSLSAPSPESERPALNWTLRYGPWLCAAVFGAMMVSTFPLALARSERLGWLEDNGVLVDGRIVDEIHTPGEGYREVIEVLRKTGEAPLRILGEVRDVSLFEGRQGVVERVRLWPDDPTIPPEIVRLAKTPPPVLFDLVLRALALFLLGCAFVALRRSALLAREGIRLQGTILGYRPRKINDSTYHYPVVRIEEPPHAGAAFESNVASFRMDRHPLGSSHPVLAHPDREVFELERPGQARIMLWGMLLMSVGLFFLPELAAWLAA